MGVMTPASRLIMTIREDKLCVKGTWCSRLVVQADGGLFFSPLLLGLLVLNNVPLWSERPVGPVVSGPTKVKGSSLIYWVNVDPGQSHLNSFSRFTYWWFSRPWYLTLGSSLAYSSVFHFSPKILTTVIIVTAFVIWDLLCARYVLRVSVIHYLSSYQLCEVGGGLHILQKRKLKPSETCPVFLVGTPLSF